MILFDDGMAVSEDCIYFVGIVDNGLEIKTKGWQFFFPSKKSEAIFARDWLIAILEEREQMNPIATVCKMVDILERVLNKLEDAEDAIGAMLQDRVQVGHA